MGNFYAYPGRKLVALRHQPGIVKGQTYQLINAKHYFSFVGVAGVFLNDGRDWDPVQPVRPTTPNISWPILEDLYEQI